MLHVKEIRDLVLLGQQDQALAALDNLLELGPKNVEALKLKALIFSQRGSFKEEEEIWSRIIQQDNEDEDGIDFLYRRHMEEREHFYFTDDVPQGRRYLAYPKNLMNLTLFLLAGCLLFLTISGYSRKYLFLAEPRVILAFFGTLVILPIIGIFYHYLFALRDVRIGTAGITFQTLLKSYTYSWQDVPNVYLTSRFYNPGEIKLFLVMLSSDPSKKSIELDLSPETSSIRARTFFIGDIKRFIPKLNYMSEDTKPTSSIKYF